MKKIELKRDGIPYHAQEFKPECESTKENLDVLANIFCLQQIYMNHAKFVALFFGD